MFLYKITTSVARLTCFYLKSLQAPGDSRVSIQKNHYKRHAIHAFLYKITTTVARLTYFYITSLQAPRDLRLSIKNHYERRAVHVLPYKITRVTRFTGFYKKCNKRCAIHAFLYKTATSVARFTCFYIKPLQASRNSCVSIYKITTYKRHAIHVFLYLKWLQASRDSRVTNRATS